MRKILVSAAAIVLLASAAYATPLTLNSTGVVGTLEGAAGGPEELKWAQHLLDMLKSTTDNVFAPGTGYATSSTEYYDVLTYGGKDESGTGIFGGGYEYLFAKYDGKNAGYVLFHMPTWYAATGSYNVPDFPYSIWGGANEEKYRISHYTVFNGTTVPDGGSVSMLLGAALLGLAGMRRLLK